MQVSLKQQAYQTIRTKILNCEYAPNSYLNEEQLCKELNVSRTPIRDALSRLEQENLIKILPKKGVVVAPLNINEINMIYETRILLEPYILATYGNRIDDNHFNELKNIISESDSLIKLITNSNSNDLSKIHELDDAFHNLIVQSSQNQYFIQCYKNIGAQNSRLRILSGNLNKDRLEKTQLEHIEITNEIIKRNYKNAADTLEAHLLASKEAAFNVILSGGFEL